MAKIDSGNLSPDKRQELSSALDLRRATQQTRLLRLLTNAYAEALGYPTVDIDEPINVEDRYEI